MAVFDQSVQVRRILYGTQSQPLVAAEGDDASDGTEDTVLDPVMKFNPYWTITGYHWDNALCYQVHDPIQ